MSGRIQSRAKRILGGFASWEDASQFSNQIRTMASQSLMPSEVLLGAYWNSWPERERGYFLTTKKLISIGGDCEIQVRWEDITHVGRGEEDKTKAETLIVSTKDGQTISISIEGGQGRFRDVFEFQRFLLRVR